MKTLYKNLLIPVASLLILASCASNLTYQQALNKNRRKIEDPKKLDDATFLVDARSFNLHQTALNDLASSAGYASAIVDLSRRMQADHKTFGADLKRLAVRKKIKLPSLMDESLQRDLNGLSNISKQDFDKRFIETARSVNQDFIYKFERMATDANDEDIRAFAARKIGVLKNHLQEVDRVEKELLNTY